MERPCTTRRGRHVATSIACGLLLPLLARCGGGGSSSNGASAPTDSVSLSFPPAESLTDADSVTVRGTADPTRVRAVRVNGLDATSTDGFATWQAVIPLAAGDNPLHIDAIDSMGMLVRDVVVGFVRRQGPLMDPNSVAIDATTGRLIVLDRARQALESIDPSSGDGFAITSSDRGSGPRLADARGLALDAAVGLAWVVDAASRAVLEVDVATGDRAVVSDATLGGGPTLVDPVDVALDPAGGQLLALDDALDAVVAVDLATGDRAVLSDATRGIGPVFSTLDSIALDATSGHALVGQHDAATADVLDVDLASGDRAVLSGTTRGTGPSFTRPGAVAPDPANGTILVLDSSWSTDPGLLEIDRAAGDRVEVSGPSRGGGPALSFSQDFAFDGARAFVSNPADLGLLAIDFATGDRSRVGSFAAIGSGATLSHVARIVVDPRHPRAFAADDGVSALIAVDVERGVRTVFADASHGRGGSFRPSALAIDPDRARLVLVAWLDGDGDASVAAVDLATGDRTILSHPPSIGSGPPFDTPVDAVLDAGSSRLFVLDMVQHRIVAVDLATGFRSILSSDLVGNGPSIARGIALELDGPRSRLVVAQDATPSGSSAPFPPLLTVDLATGDRAELADPTPLDGIELEQPQDLAFDAAQDRLLALDRGSVYAIDPASGERTLVADGGRTDQGPSLFHGEALALDAARHVALVAGGTAAFRGLVSILIAIDLEQPQRAVLSISR